jgi:hypothetical protein
MSQLPGSSEPLQTFQADALARSLTNGHLRVSAEGGFATFKRDGQKLAIKLPLYRLTAREIERVVAENGPWGV